MLPHVILHSSTSIDGRSDWFTPDSGLHYDLLARWNADAHLMDSETLVSASQHLPAADPAPLLVIPDGRGKMRIWGILQQRPIWRGGVALCASSTPQSYADYLRGQGVTQIIAGDDLLDMRTALAELRSQHGIQTVVTNCGGTLNGALLRAGLVNEVSLLLHPCLVGGTTPQSCFRAPDLAAAEGVIRLNLIAVEPVKDGMIWLRYAVTHSPA